MNDNRCPKCDLLNLPEAVSCLKCRTPLGHSGATANFSDAKTTELTGTGTADYEAQTVRLPEFRATTAAEISPSTAGYSLPVSFDQTGADFPPATRTGGRTYFWYRMFCSVVTVFGIILAILGIIAMLGSFNETGEKATSAFSGGVMFLIAGGAPALLCLLGVLFPPRSWTWIYGLALLILATLSCAPAIFSIPLLIFWVKPETQSFFGRN